MKLDRQCACVVFVCYVCVLCVVFVCCVCVLCVLCVVFVCLCVVCLCVVCLCLCHVLSFTYVFADHLLVSFTYHLPVGLSLSEVARVRAHFKFFFEWLSKGSLQKYMNDPCFSFGCVVRLPLFFFSVVRYLRGGGYLQARPWSPGLHPRWHQMPIFSLCLSCTNWILLAWILHTATHMYPQICAAQSLKRLLPPLVHSSELGGL